MCVPLLDFVSDFHLTQFNMCNSMLQCQELDNVSTWRFVTLKPLALVKSVAHTKPQQLENAYVQ